jgi:hypothetical protein
MRLGYYKYDSVMVNNITIAGMYISVLSTNRKLAAPWAKRSTFCQTRQGRDRRLSSRLRGLDLKCERTGASQIKLHIQNLKSLAIYEKHSM